MDEDMRTFNLTVPTESSEQFNELKKALGCRNQNQAFAKIVNRAYVKHSAGEDCVQITVKVMEEEGEVLVKEGELIVIVPIGGMKIIHKKRNGDEVNVLE